MGKAVGLFGGSFDPIHFGHLIAARAVAEQKRLNRVIFLPSRWPPHKSAADAAESNHRAKMVRLAIAEEPFFEFSDFDLTRPGPTYTIDTVQHFKAALGPDEAPAWIIGADSLPELAGWYRAVELVDACTILTAVRPGFVPRVSPELESVFGPKRMKRLMDGIVETPLIGISATEIRARTSRGLSIRYLVPEPVRRYIERYRLYTEPTGLLPS